MMTEWNVDLEFQRELTEERIEILLEALKPYSAVGSGGTGFSMSGVMLSVDAPTAAAAFEEAWRLVTNVEPVTAEEVLRFEVRRQADMD